MSVQEIVDLRSFSSKSEVQMFIPISTQNEKIKLVYVYIVFMFSLHLSLCHFTIFTSIIKCSRRLKMVIIVISVKNEPKFGFGVKSCTHVIFVCIHAWFRYTCSIHIQTACSVYMHALYIG